MQTLTIRCNDDMATHLTSLLKNLKGVDFDANTEQGAAKKKSDLKDELTKLFQKYRDVKPFASVKNSSEWQKDVRNEW